MAVLKAELKQRAQKAARVLAKMATLRAAYVFGSTVEGRADSWSDIDLALFLEDLESWSLDRRGEAVYRVQKEAGLDVEPHLFPASVFDKPDPASFVAYIIAHGVRLPLDDPAA